MKNQDKAAKIHGIMLMSLFALSALYLSNTTICQTLKLSPLIIGVLIGILYANTLRMHLPSTWVPGILFSSKTILRIAIAFFGFRLTLTDIMQVGWPGVLIDIIMIISVVLIGLFFGKILGIDKETTILVSSGSAICGAAAVMATEPVLDSKPHKTVIAVSTVVIFGTISMLVYPIAYRFGYFNFLSERGIGIYTGSTLHEVAHVAGAGQAMGSNIAGIATITKMIRVIMLAPFLLILGLSSNKKKSIKNTSDNQKVITIPWFAIWFLIFIGINTLISIVASKYEFETIYHNINENIKTIDTYALTIAMTAIGSEASIDKFKKAGTKPFILAFIIYLWLIFGGIFITHLIIHLK